MFGGEKKKLKFYCCVGFKNVPVFETTPTKSSYFPMSTYGTYAGRAAYPDNAGQNTHVHCDHIHNDATSGIWLRIKNFLQNGHLGFSTFSNQAVLR